MDAGLIWDLRLRDGDVVIHGSLAESNGQGRILHAGAIPFGGVGQSMEVLQAGKDGIDA